MTRAVLLFARDPGAEAGKKHIRGGAALFEACAQRVARAAAAAGAELVVAGAGLYGSHPRIAQRGDTFEARFLAAFSDVAALGFRQIVAVGGDIPGLSPRELEAAFDALAQGRAVLGPSPDGGAYLIGVDAAWIASLRGVRWRSPLTFADLQARLPGARVLRALVDLDELEDLPAVAAHFDDRVLAACVRAALGRPPPPRGSGVAAPARGFTAARSPRGPPAHVA